jgi:hypothetical protein
MNRFLLASFLSLALLSGAQAAGEKKKGKSAVPTRGVAEDGKEVQKDVQTLTETISWMTSLDDAKALARKEGKMVFWWHVLGDLNGST